MPVVVRSHANELLPLRRQRTLVRYDEAAITYLATVSISSDFPLPEMGGGFFSEAHFCAIAERCSR
jgi:hypothetical protein